MENKNCNAKETILGVEVQAPLTNESLSDQEWADILTKVRKANKFPVSRMSNQSGKPKFNTKVKETRFSKINTVIKTTTVPTSQINNVKQRGLNMMEERLKLITPVKIEYNLDATVKEFNIINALQELFEQMSESDQIFKFLHSGTKDILWETGSKLPESDEFKTLFHMRERNFRKGNSKVTIHGTVGSISPINSIKLPNQCKASCWKETSGLS